MRSSRNTAIPMLMFIVRQLWFGQAMAALCLGLALLFGAASLSNTLDQLQHAAPLPHDHLVLGDLTIDQDHADHQADIKAGEVGTPSDVIPGSHHHHSDVSSGMLAAGPTNGFSPSLADQLFAPMTASAPPNQMGYTPERPPRAILHG